MEVSAAVAWNDCSAANGQEVALALDHVADNRIPVMTRHARACQHNVCSEFALGHVQRAAGNRWCSPASRAQCAQAVGTNIHVAVDLELGVIGGVDPDSSKVASAIMKRPNCDDIIARVLIHTNKWAANTNVFFINRMLGDCLPSAFSTEQEAPSKPIAESL